MLYDYRRMSKSITRPSSNHSTTITQRGYPVFPKSHILPVKIALSASFACKRPIFVDDVPRWNGGTRMRSIQRKGGICLPRVGVPSICNANKSAGSYKCLIIHGKTYKKCAYKSFFLQNICKIQKKSVSLQPNLQRLANMSNIKPHMHTAT